MNLNQWVMKKGSPEDRAEVLAESLDFVNLLPGDYVAFKQTIAALYRQNSLFIVSIENPHSVWFTSFNNTLIEDQSSFTKYYDDISQVIIRTYSYNSITTPGFVLYDNSWKKAIVEGKREGYCHAAIFLTEKSAEYYEAMKSIHVYAFAGKGPFAQEYMCRRLGWESQVYSWLDKTTGISYPRITYDHGYGLHLDAD